MVLKEDLEVDLEGVIEEEDVVEEGLSPLLGGTG